MVIGSRIAGHPFLGPLVPRIAIGGVEARLKKATTSWDGGRSQLVLEYAFSPQDVQLTQRFESVDGEAIRVSSTLRNRSLENAYLTWVKLLSPAAGAEVKLCSDPDRCRIYEQGNYWTKVRPLQSGSEGVSSLVWESFDTSSRISFCVGFETQERWSGQIHTEQHAGKVSWSYGFDGGDVRIAPGEEVPLEDVLLLSGRDPMGDNRDLR